MDNLIELKVIDPLHRGPEKQSAQPEYSPMDPPDAFSPPAQNDISYEDMHPVLQELMDEHKACIVEIDAFEAILGKLFTDGFTREVNDGIRSFFYFYDNSILFHNRKEDKGIFLDLQHVLLEKGEFSTSNEHVTVVDLMEDDHIKAMQLAAIAFNLFGLAPRISDNTSRLIILDLAVEQSNSLIELLKLHIFREDNIVFPLAHRYLSEEQLEKIGANTVTATESS